jgi:hypothetical protein
MRSTLLVTLVIVGSCSTPCEPTWSVELDAPGGALLAGAGDADDGWLVGGGLGDGGARVLRWDGTTLTEVTTDRPQTLWWVWIAPDGAVWMVGEGGVVLRDLEPLDSGVTSTLYGVWGAAADDVWVVGEAGVVLRWDGTAFHPLAVPGAERLFKVWGARADDVWIGGSNGALWRWRGGQLEDHARATAANVLTVHGCSADEVYATVGSHVWRWDGTNWIDEPIPAVAMVTGVACGEAEVLVVGVQGTRLRRDRSSGAWTSEQLEPYIASDFHSTWLASDRTAWALGGDYLAPPGAGDRRGVIARRACR